MTMQYARCRTRNLKQENQKKNYKHLSVWHASKIMWVTVLKLWICRDVNETIGRRSNSISYSWPSIYFYFRTLRQLWDGIGFWVSRRGGLRFFCSCHLMSIARRAINVTFAERWVIYVTKKLAVEFVYLAIFRLRHSLVSVNPTSI